MKNVIKNLLFLPFSCLTFVVESQTDTAVYREPFRPQIHFSPKEHWMNDPNGMVYYKGVYHLFFQYYPGDIVWGPMHWGHATSKDLVHWQQQPIALYPDTLGYIFSGSAVVDWNNSSGFGKNNNPPLVAIFTHHEPIAEKEKKNNFQNQSLAYSLDNGKSWIKYPRNPVLKNPGIRDFRDPKVFWYDERKKWIMTLAIQDHIGFYSSRNLKSWAKESEFGKQSGAHGGVWECPDLFSLNYGKEKFWVLIVNINPGGPNKGSATQYFIGKFDGKNFTPFDDETRWLDYGPDEYAGVTWSNTGDRRIFFGWMSNWLYGQNVPTKKWRSAMTIPRDLELEKIGKKYFITSRPLPEVLLLGEKKTELKNISVTNYDLTKIVGKLNAPATLKLNADQIKSFTITLSNDKNEKLVIGFDKVSNNYFIDRTHSGNVDFEKDFAAKHFAPRFSQQPNFDLTLIIDQASVELFADDGLTVMTEIFFPSMPYTNVTIQADNNLMVKSIQFTKMSRIWN